MTKHTIKFHGVHAARFLKRVLFDHSSSLCMKGLSVYQLYEKGNSTTGVYLENFLLQDF